MNAVLKKYETTWKQAENGCDALREDASFTEIYELIFYNKAIVRSELEVLLQLIQKKLMENTGATPTCTGSNSYGTNMKKNVTARIRPVCT